MTEDQIERKIEQFVDSLDARFLNSSMTQAEYDVEMRSIRDWADREYFSAQFLKSKLA